MIEKEKEGIVWFEFELLQPYPFIHHAIFSRRGGISPAPYESLNLSFSVGDSVQSVEQNRKRAFSAIGLAKDVSLIEGQQVHKTHVEEVEADGLKSTLVTGCDGFITALCNVALSIQHADCQAALLYDPTHKALAALHAGWRGSVGNIYQKAINQMQKAYGTKADELIACISPSLGPQHAQFIHYEKELPRPFWEFREVEPYFNFNFWEISRWQLESAGVRRQNIEIAKICTYSEKETFFSYRRDKLCGRHLSVVWKSPLYTS